MRDRLTDMVQINQVTAVCACALSLTAHRDLAPAERQTKQTLLACDNI